jgi:hypothetical protein
LLYLSASNKYLKDYAAEQAWREDVRRLSTGKRLAHLFRVVMSVGRSLWWCGYSQGLHLEEELLIEGAGAAPGRGKQVGAKPKPPRLQLHQLRMKSMTTPAERTCSVMRTRAFLLQVAISPDVPERFKVYAEMLLRHYPSTVDVALVADACPEWFQAP